jgi:hypothetical protein
MKWCVTRGAQHGWVKGIERSESSSDFGLRLLCFCLGAAYDAKLVSVGRGGRFDRLTARVSLFSGRGLEDGMTDSFLLVIPAKAGNALQQ